jgi:hypothetical protein
MESRIWSFIGVPGQFHLHSRKPEPVVASPEADTALKRNLLN